jgi:hypothetical protein
MDLSQSPRDPTPLTYAELDAIEARIQAATPGPWEQGIEYSYEWEIQSGYCFDCRDTEGPVAVLTGDEQLRVIEHPEDTPLHVHRYELSAESDNWQDITSPALMARVISTERGSGSEIQFTADATFIAHAREDVPRLLDEVRRQRQVMLEWAARLEQLRFPEWAQQMRRDAGA